MAASSATWGLLELPVRGEVLQFAWMESSSWWPLVQKVGLCIFMCVLVQLCFSVAVLVLAFAFCAIYLSLNNVWPQVGRG